MNDLNVLLTGAIAMACVVIALFFLRFWRQTNDRFFALFASAFGLEAANRMALALYWHSETDSTFYFLVRLISYALIILAITDKNWKRKT